MKKILLSVCIICFWGSTLLYGQNEKTDVVYKLITRITGEEDLPVRLSLKPSEETYFQYWAEDGTLQIEGSSPVALCRGFYDFIKSNGGGLYSWSGNNIRFPEQLDNLLQKRVVSPFPNHYYFNACTYGYSMPYWDWERWEKEIDWMALHGINMPLALVGYEAILARVWKQMGLTDEEINDYFVGPAHLPWGEYQWC